MGWRGFVRSVNASANRQRRASERRGRAIDKLHKKRDGVIEKIDSEVEREIEKVTKWEQKIEANPVKGLSLSYDNNTHEWSTEPLEDNVGIITYTFQPKYTTIPAVNFDPPTFTFKDVVITPLALIVSQYFTAIAFEADATSKDKDGILKFANLSAPENSSIAIMASNGDTFLPTGTSLDGRLFPGSRKVGVLTFEAFDKGVDCFELLIVRKDEDEPLRIKVSASNLSTVIAEELNARSLLDTFVEQVRKKQSEATAEIKETVKKATSSGCLLSVLLIAVAFVVFICVVGLLGK